MEASQKKPPPTCQLVVREDDGLQTGPGTQLPRDGSLGARENRRERAKSKYSMATYPHKIFLAYRVVLGTDSDLEKMAFGFQPRYDNFYVEWLLSCTLRKNMEFGEHIPAYVSFCSWLDTTSPFEERSCVFQRMNGNFSAWPVLNALHVVWRTRDHLELKCEQLLLLSTAATEGGGVYYIPPPFHYRYFRLCTSLSKLEH